jgi:SAM-dependent methyltransferase
MSTITACRSCEEPGLLPVLDLGRTPLANALPTPEEIASGAPEETFPLELVFCPRCSLLQINETVAPEILFRNYLYFSSFSDQMVRHAEAIADRLVTSEKLGPNSLACEIASNDGYLLQHYKKRGVPVLGIEPAVNVAKVAREERGVDTLAEFFGREVGERLAREGRKADVIHANNVLAHVADLNGVIAGFAAWLKDTGVAVVEAPYAKPFIDHVEFDTIYHEHLCYFSLTAIDRLAARHGLVVRDVERLPIHGGSLRYFLAKASHAERGPAVVALLAEEKAWGVLDHAAYVSFAERVNELRGNLTTLLADLKAAGRSIAAYGAAAKGSTLINFFGIGKETLDFVADRSTYKQGRVMPGVHVPIVAAEELAKRQPDYCLLLTWNFADEILAQQSAYRKAGGKFIVPVPEARIR